MGDLVEGPWKQNTLSETSSSQVPNRSARIVKDMRKSSLNRCDCLTPNTSNYHESNIFHLIFSCRRDVQQKMSNTTNTLGLCEPVFWHGPMCWLCWMFFLLDITPARIWICYVPLLKIVVKLRFSHCYIYGFGWNEGFWMVLGGQPPQIDQPQRPHQQQHDTRRMSPQGASCKRIQICNGRSLRVAFLQARRRFGVVLDKIHFWFRWRYA